MGARRSATTNCQPLPELFDARFGTFWPLGYGTEQNNEFAGRSRVFSCTKLTSTTKAMNPSGVAALHGKSLYYACTNHIQVFFFG